MISFEERFDNKNNNSILKFSKQNDKLHVMILDLLLKLNKEVNFLIIKLESYERIEHFKYWFMYSFMELMQNDNISINNKINYTKSKI